MKKTLLKLTPIALAITTLTACSPASETAKTAPEPIKTEKPAGQSESERLNAFFERTFEENLKRSPLFQSYLGKKWDYDKWDDISEEEADARLAIAKARSKESRALW